MMNSHKLKSEDLFLTRRDFLRQCGMGMGALGLVGMLGPAAPAGSLPTDGANPLLPRKPHFAARAKRVIHIFANGGPSQIDTFDPKPALQKYAGKMLPFENPKTERPTGAAFPSPFGFRKYGQSGLEVSELFPHVGACADDLCVIRSMQADVPNHEPSFLLMNCGEARLPRPSLGSWTTYGLGTENQNLPGFIVMCPGGYPTTGAENWQSAFLPGIFQGAYINSQHADVEHLISNLKNYSMPREHQREQMDLLMRLNREHQNRRAEDAHLEARIQSFELAYRMQMEATDAFDLAQEPEHIRTLYGPGVQARQLLIARRLLERGVRFVQVYTGEGQPWDNHDSVIVKHRKLAQECDQAIAGLLTDLKQRGLLEDTLVIWGGEFGRTPTVEIPKNESKNPAVKLDGRDHNHYGFTMWLAGGGVKPGHIHGATDEFGYKAIEHPVHVHDLHATILHLLGFDHEQFTYRYSGRDFRLTDVHGHLVEGILA